MIEKKAMNEFFLHYIWQRMMFDRCNLKTIQGEEIVIFNSGIGNANDGPDFLNAQIQLDGIKWYGHIEIHINEIDWQYHQHDLSKAYDNVILHVVWQCNDNYPRKIPTLELCSRVSKNDLNNYLAFINSEDQLPCTFYRSKIPYLHTLSMLESMAIERLEVKSNVVASIYQQTGHDLQETMYQMVAKSFGMKTNAVPFVLLAEKVPLKKLLKHIQNDIVVQAMVFGVSGLLFRNEGEGDDYTKALKKEFQYWGKIYDLEVDKEISSMWKFMRTRPYNFPTVRLAQFLKFIKYSEGFKNLRDISSFEIFERITHEIDQSNYWDIHYDFGKTANGFQPHIGKALVDHIIINALLPVWFFKANLEDNEDKKYKILEILRQLPAENNNLVKKMKSNDFSVKSAFDSQALIQLYTTYCDKSACLSCKIGATVFEKFIWNI